MSIRLEREWNDECLVFGVSRPSPSSYPTSRQKKIKVAGNLERVMYWGELNGENLI